MKYIVVIILILSCSPMFINDQKMDEIWIGENYNDIIDILGPYNKKIEDLSKQGHNILIWEAKLFCSNAFGFRKLAIQEIKKYNKKHVRKIVEEEKKEKIIPMMD